MKQNQFRTNYNVHNWSNNYFQLKKKKNDMQFFPFDVITASPFFHQMS